MTDAAPAPKRPRARRGRTIARALGAVFALGLLGLVAYWASQNVFLYGWPVFAARDPKTIAIHGTTMAVVKYEPGPRNSLSTLDLETGERRLISDDLSQPRGLALDDDWIVWSTYRHHDSQLERDVGATYAARIEGGALVPILNRPMDLIVLGGGYAYAGGRGEVFSGPLGSPMKHHPAGSLEGHMDGGAYAIAANSKELFALKHDSLDAWDHGLGTKRTLSAGCLGDGLAATEDAVFVACRGEAPGPEARIDRIALASGARETWHTAPNVTAVVPTDAGLVLGAWGGVGLLRGPETPIVMLAEGYSGVIAVRPPYVYLTDDRFVVRTRLP